MAWNFEVDVLTDLCSEKVWKNQFKGIIKTFCVKFLRNDVFEMIQFFVEANLELPFYLK